MSKARTLENILSKVIVPQYRVLDSVKVKVMGGAMDVFFYNVSYIVNGSVNMTLAQNITRETVSLFNMMGEPRGSDIGVFFYDEKGNYAL